MKQLLAILLATIVLLSCNTKSNETGKNDSTTVSERHNEHIAAAGGLVLNNGVKWKADSTTVANVALLQTIVSNGKKESPGQYLQTAALLQDGLNKMVSECKMSGADHDALHHWLEPLLKKVKALNKETLAESAADNLKDIEKHLALFAQYFE